MKDILIILFVFLVKTAFSQVENEEKYTPAPDYIYFGTSEGLTLVNLGGKEDSWGEVYGGLYGFVDSADNVVIKPTYQRLSWFKDGLAAVCIDGKMGYINKSEELVIPCIFGYDGFRTGEFAEDRACVRIDKRYGYIDKTGTVVIPCVYDFGYGFENGRALVSKNDKWGILDREGKIVIPIVYDDRIVFKDGAAQVSENGKLLIIDESGTILAPKTSGK